MLATDLLSRSLGDVTPLDLERASTTRFLRALQPGPHVRYAGSSPGLDSAAVAHGGGVNALAVDRFEGRYVVSGGADGRISMWDLDLARHSGRVTTHEPQASVDRTAQGHTFGVTGLSFYPFDSMAFMSSSYDHTLKLFDSVSMAATASFTLSSVIYAHAISPVADHLLVACATQHPAVRLVDLKSGAATHSLVGHSGGAVLAVAWSPRDQHILASGASDGTVRLWDVRRSSGALGVLDMDDSVGVAGHDGLGSIARRRERGRAHLGPVNGLTWTDDARHLVSAGHDERIRVWEAATGANTLANFGPSVRNESLSNLPLVLVPKRLVSPGEDVLFYPNEEELLVYELFEARMLKRLKATSSNAPRTGRSAQRNLRNRFLALAWRAHKVELLSGHADGTIRSWLPRTSIDAAADASEDEASGEHAPADAPSRKRKADTAAIGLL